MSNITKAMIGVQILSSQSFVLLYFLCFLHVYIFTFCLQICKFALFIFCAFLGHFRFCTFLFCTFILFVLLYFLIWLDSPYELPFKFGVCSSKKWLSYEYFCTYVLLYFFVLLYFCILFGLSIRASMKNLESVAQKMTELSH